MRLRRAELTLALGVALFGASLALLPAVAALEEQVGLATLFSLRGIRIPPEGIEIITISGESAAAYEVPSYLREWPRRLHAALIDRLSAAGAAAIVVDIAFEAERDPEGDALLAAAIRRSGRVILLERIRASRIDLPGLDSPARTLRQVPVLDPLASAALGRGPFLLPTVPIRTSQFWAFGPGALDGPTLPALATQVRLADEYELFMTALGDVATVPSGLPVTREALFGSGALEVTMRDLRSLFVTDPGLGDSVRTRLDGLALQSDTRSRLEVLVDLYSGPGSHYLNFYGPSGTFPARQYHEIVRTDDQPPATDGLEDMVVFVGFAEREQSEQQDEFISVYSESSGLSLSGVEIGATAFANLLTTTAVRPLDRNVELLLLASLGFVLALLAGRAPLWLVYAASAVAAVAYLALAVNVFDARNLWLPLIVPLGVQLPVLVLGTTLLRYRRVAEQRSLLRSALGPYAAPSVVTRLARETTRTSGAGQVVHGTCLVTDVSGYTGLAERLGPAELAALMDEYFRAIGRVVADCGGTVADIAGDSMVGVWVAAERQPGTSRSAAEAAIGIERALTAFNAERAQTPLATPIGLEAGVVALTRQADVPALPFRAVGDIVNTAARIQALNRHLGTRLLIGDSVHDALGGWPARRVGRFLLFGKRIPLTIWELEAAATERPDGASLIGDEFAAALALFERGRLQAARSAFADLAAGVPADPVSAFYADQCESLLERGLPDAWDGTIVMRDK